MRIFGFVLASTIFAAAGCAGADANRDTAEYQAGYADGCATGGARGGQIAQDPQRNEDLYRNNSDYRAGWASGYNVCSPGSNSRRF